MFFCLLQHHLVVHMYIYTYILYIYTFMWIYLGAVWHDIWNLNFALYSFFSEATIPPKSYAGRFVKHFSEHVIEVDEVLETAFHCALWWLNRVLWKIDENRPFSSMIWLLRMVIFHCKQLKVQGTLHIRWKEAAPDPLDSDFVEAIPRFLGHPAGYESWSDKAPTLNPVPPRKSYFWGFNTVFLVVVSYIKQDNFARFVRVDKFKLLSISAEVPLEVQSIRAQRTLLGSLELQPGTMERPWEFTRCGWAKMG